MGGHGGVEVEPASASRFSTLQNLVKPFVGAGILALPNAFKQGGVLASAILMVILAIGVNYCIRCLLTSVDYTYAREHGLEFNETTGQFKRAVIDAADEEGGSGSLNGDAAKAGKDDYARVQNGDAEERPPSPSRNGSKAGRRSPSTVALASSSSAAVSPSRTQPTQISVMPDGAAAPRARSKAAAASNGVDDVDFCTSPPVYSFREIGDFAYGRWGRLAVDVNLVASQLGFCIAYMSFISQNMHEVLGSIGRVEWIGILFLGWSVFTQIRSMRHIGVTSGFGNLVYFVSLGIIFYDGFRYSCCISASEADWVRPQGLALVFGTGCFALEGIGLVLPVKRAMKEQDRFGYILNVAIAIVATCYVVFGVLGYLFYGEAVSSVITKNLGGGALSDSVRVSLSISLFFTYLIQLFPVSEILDGIWDSHVFYPSNTAAAALGGAQGNDRKKYQSFDGEVREADSSTATFTALPDGSSSSSSSSGNGAVHKPSAESESSSGRDLNLRREFALVSTRVLLVAFTAGVSIAFPNFGLIVSLVGSFSNSAIAFILPQIFYIKLVLRHPERSAAAWESAQSDQWWVRNKAFVLPWVIIVLGVCASIIGVTTTIQDMISGDS